jgi:cytochrome c
MRRRDRLRIGTILLVLAGCRGEGTAPVFTDRAPARGAAAIGVYGCGSCHTIPGIRGADALVGPPLDRVASRTYIAGVMANTRDNLVRWIKDPPGVDPLTAMPNLRVNDDDARDIARYLSTLR